ncbi:MAG: phosphoenolpyruvate carboxylase, partial [Terriglobales bacterium]
MQHQADLISDDHEFSDRIKPLRDDIRMLGLILGDTIKCFDGLEVFDCVEKFRNLCKKIHQEHDEQARRELNQLAGSLSPEAAAKVIKAFLTYFDIINIAEQNHRLRRLALRSSNLTASPEDSLGKLFAKLDRKVAPDEIVRFLSRLDIEVVFTAHPTEITRRTVLMKQLELAELLYKRDHPPLSLRDQVKTATGLRGVVESLWLTDHVIYFKPSVMDEVRYAMYHFDNVVIDAVLDVHETLARVCELTAGSPANYKYEPRTFITFGSWIGGDRDGNPYVTTDVTKQTLDYERSVILNRYIKEMEKLFNDLCHSENWIGLESRLAQSIAADARELPAIAERYFPRYQFEPYRMKLLFMHAKLRNTLAALTPAPASAEGATGATASVAGATGGQTYSTPSEFRDDLALLRSALEQSRCSASLTNLHRLMNAVDIFGFHLAKLDIRQHNMRHVNAMNEITETLGIIPGGFAKLSEAER